MSLLKSREVVLGLVIILLIGIIATRFPAFVAPANLARVFTDTSPLILLALGQMAVILTKCIDLS
ncbi:MAG: ABC transporter permease, partial [Paracoccus sp. (in: a-proteobacteria)]|nr:ABC transporter permease [Paracoccus sp. (in: a-proteobacteria)]